MVICHVFHSLFCGVTYVGVPFCYFPSDFPNYAIVSNEATDFGQIVKSQTTFMPNDILDLTVDLIYET